MSQTISKSDIPVFMKANRFLEKLGYTKEEIRNFNKYDGYQVIELYNTIKGINRNIKQNCSYYNYEAFTNI